MIHSALAEGGHQNPVLAWSPSPASRRLSPSSGGGARELARRLLAEAERGDVRAPLLREAAQELLKLAILIGPVSEAQICADYVRSKLGLRHRGSALLLLELMERPGIPHKAPDLAQIVCTKSVNASSVKVFVHELRSVLTGFGIENAVLHRAREGYLVQEAMMPQIQALLR
ncbi:hypothetical protein [Sphingomonas azotifigens]|uniref:hypothetical protein n=1 Tax=Sphingomonas azotifigens TaxID=330920 RepID=UPI00111C78D0|nr:hypothetical protein [Sphingomonas azotifigens]